MKLITLESLQTFASRISDLFVKKESGKSLSSNDLTDALKSNYDAAYNHSQDAHAPSGAQVNVIESVKVNGVAQTVSSKAVDISVPAAYSHPNSGVSAGTYRCVTVNTAGHVTAGINPTTVSGYGITDAYTKTEVDTKVNGLIDASDAMVFKGTIGSGGTITALPASHKIGDTYKVLTAGTHAGDTCEPGDLIICTTSGSSANDTHWTVVQTNVDGTVTGPVSATSNAIALFNGTTGKLISNSSKTIVTSISGSPNVPTDSAVKSFVEGKGYALAADFVAATTTEIDVLFA